MEECQNVELIQERIKEKNMNDGSYVDKYTGENILLGINSMVMNDKTKWCNTNFL